MGPKSSSAKGKISLEDYLNFNAAHSYDQISVSYLNQIILMNGFKILKQPKIVIVDAVESMDFMDPSRSTLSENISPHAPISLEEAIKDLVLLNWQECCITSIQTVISGRVNSSSSKQESLLVPSVERSKKNPKAKAQQLISLPGSAHASSCAPADVGKSIRNSNGRTKRRRLLV